jgi:hypothetical protein
MLKAATHLNDNQVLNTTTKIISNINIKLLG